MRSVLFVCAMALLLVSLGCQQDSSGDAETKPTASKTDRKSNKGSKKPSEKGKKGSTKSTLKKGSKSEDKGSGAKTADKKPTGKNGTSKPSTDKTEAEPKDKTAEVIPKGRPFEGPPSEAIVGLWNIRINRDSLPEGIKNFEELDKTFKGTMKFDGKIATVNISGQSDALPYKVVRDEDQTLELALAGGSDAKFKVTFLNHDNIKLRDNQRDGELLGARELGKDKSN
ncbi:MAG: hypothetical protein AAFS10_16230 [Myxococcota bacterium]